ALLAVAVILLTEVVDVLVDLFFPEPADQKIQQKAGDGSQGRLGSQDLQSGSQVHCLGDKNGQHCVRSGQKDCHEGAGGDQTSGVQAGGRGGKSALGHRPQGGSCQGT